MNFCKSCCGEESRLSEMVGMACGIHQPLGWRAPNTGFLQPVSEASQGRVGKMSLPHAAAELPPLNSCESFLLPQHGGRGGDGQGQGQEVKGAQVIQLGSKAGKCGTEGVPVVLTCGKRGKWRFFRS